MFAEILKKLMANEDLTSDEATHAMTAVMTGEAGEARTAGLLTALALKGETGTEIEAFARAMRKAAVSWPGGSPEILADTCGTGGDGASTLNISTLTAMLLASLGIPVAKHGNRAVSSKSGSADLLEGLGVRLNLTHEETANELERAGITFLFAPMWHPAMKYAAPVRKALGFRTVFNLLGPLTNPAPITHQVIGVFSQEFMERMAAAVALLGRKGAYVLHSEDGLDELSPAAPTHFIRIEAGEVREQGKMQPEDFGFSPVSLDELRTVSREEALKRSQLILEGAGQPAENQTIAMNAGLVYSLTKGGDLKSSAALCLDALRSGQALELLKKWAR